MARGLLGESHPPGLGRDARGPEPRGGGLTSAARTPVRESAKVAVSLKTFPAAIASLSRAISS